MDEALHLTFRNGVASSAIEIENNKNKETEKRFH